MSGNPTEDSARQPEAGHIDWEEVWQEYSVRNRCPFTSREFRWNNLARVHFQSPVSGLIESLGQGAIRGCRTPSVDHRGRRCSVRQCVPQCCGGNLHIDVGGRDCPPGRVTIRNLSGLAVFPLRIRPALASPGASSTRISGFWAKSRQCSTTIKQARHFRVPSAVFLPADFPQLKLRAILELKYSQVRKGDLSRCGSRDPQSQMVIASLGKMLHLVSGSSAVWHRSFDRGGILRRGSSRILRRSSDQHHGFDIRNIGNPPNLMPLI
jgi:hypothetical protein